MSSAINFYKHIPKKYSDGSKGKYKNYDKIKIEVPLRLLIVGSSGSMKTNCLLNIISQLNAWQKIYLCGRNINQPLYRFLIDILDENTLFTCENVDDLPQIEEFDPKLSNLLIFDDMICENNTTLKKISSYFVRGRHVNISSVFLSQSYFDTPKLVRKNCDYIILKKINTKKDLKMLLKEYNIDDNVDDVMNIYQKVSKLEPQNWLLIDLITSDNSLKYRLNFSPINIQQQQ